MHTHHFGNATIVFLRTLQCRLNFIYNFLIENKKKKKFELQKNYFHEIDGMNFSDEKYSKTNSDS